MNLVDRIILNRGEKALLPFRSNGSILSTPDFVNYNKYLPLLKTTYENAEYWHGTGRYQYSHSIDSRYEKTDFGIHMDLLESILKDGSLRPHHEPWLKKMAGIFSPTISMTPFRMYARLYAGLYLYEKDILLYEFGTTKFWFQFLYAVQLLNRKFLQFIFTRQSFNLIRRSSYKNIQLYISSIRSDTDKKPVNPFRGHLIRTDIPENYPILVGIKKDIKTISFNTGMERLERRSVEPILLENITHIEVPLNKIKITEDFLKQANISLIVVPLEFGEIYCSTYKLEKLTGIPN